MLDLQSITAVLAKVGIKIPETYLKEEIVRIIAESSSERIAEIPLVLGSIPSAPQAILDVGCRYSLLPIQLASIGHSVDGVDINPYKRTHPNFRFHQVDILKPPFKAGTFDIAISLSTVEHIGLTRYKDDKNEQGDIDTLLSIHKLLKKDGTVILTVPFGQAMDTQWYRVYDLDRVSSLLKGYQIVEKSAYKQAGEYWVPATIEEAEKLDSSQRAKAMLFVRAKKK